MNEHVSDIAFSPAVKAMQTRRGSRATYSRVEENSGWPDALTPEVMRFIAARDSFYLATASADGQPYVQHRGGPVGFLRVLDAHTLAFADLRGNRQYISTGNLTENDKVCLFLMDYPARRRLKIWGRARLVEDDDTLLAQVNDPAYAAPPEGVILITITAWDRNCPQHITPRFTAAEMAPEIQKLRDRIAELEAENAALRARTTSG